MIKSTNIDYFMFFLHSLRDFHVFKFLANTQTLAIPVVNVKRNIILQISAAVLANWKQ